MSDIRKQSRITKACDSCHKRGRRCRIGPGSAETCTTCAEAGILCTRNRIASKRGPKPGSRHLRSVPPTKFTTTQHQHELERFLVTSFFQYVYPVVNHIHEQSFMNSCWQTQPQVGESSYARYMAVCALSAYRTINGIQSAPSTLKIEIKPEYFLERACSATQSTSVISRSLEYLQAISLICVIGLEISDVSLTQRYMGVYHATVAEQCLCDERRWPVGLSTIEREQRRRIFWHMYRLEVHMAMVMGHAIRCPELQSNVTYPESEGDDTPDDVEWLSGWNFVTDLYRGLEHLLAKVRLLRDSRTRQRSALSTTFLTEYDHDKLILAPLNSAYDALPVRFKTAAPMSTNTIENRCGFQTANIVCTFLLLKMVGYSWSRATLEQACSTAFELVEKITSIPLEYLKTMSVAMTQELSGFGYILSNFIGKDLPRAGYQDLKNVILCMAEFLESLDSKTRYARRASLQLREYVRKIDDLLQNMATSDNGHQLNGTHDKPISDQSQDVSVDSRLLSDYSDLEPWTGNWMSDLWDMQQFTWDMSWDAMQI